MIKIFIRYLIVALMALQLVSADKNYRAIKIYGYVTCKGEPASNVAVVMLETSIMAGTFTEPDGSFRIHGYGYDDNGEAEAKTSGIDVVLVILHKCTKGEKYLFFETASYSFYGNNGDNVDTRLVAGKEDFDGQSIVIELTNMDKPERENKYYRNDWESHDPEEEFKFASGKGYARRFEADNIHD